LRIAAQADSAFEFSTPWSKEQRRYIIMDAARTVLLDYLLGRPGAGAGWQGVDQNARRAL
jgi:hypothetical protein